MSPQATHDHDASNPQEAASEWTQVTSKSRRGRRSNNSNGNGNSSAKNKKHQQQLPVGPRTHDLRPAEDLAADYARLRARWELEPCCRRLRDLVAANAAAFTTISRAINLGIGTFDPADGAWEAKRSTFVQLIAFLIMVDELETITGKKIPCVFQDPIFSQSDKDFLVGLGHEVAETPAACDMVDSDSLLYGVHLYRAIYAMALEKSLPAIFVGTGWDVWDDLSNTEGLEKMGEMDKAYKRSAFPQDSQGAAFGVTSIYWKPVAETKAEAAVESTPKDPEDVATIEDELSSKLESTTIS